MRHPDWTTWLLSVIGGAATAVMYLTLGIYGVALLLLLLFATSRLPDAATGFAGVLVGVGGALTLLTARAELACAAANTATSSCVSHGGVAALVAGAAFAAIGMIMTLRRVVMTSRDRKTG